MADRDRLLPAFNLLAGSTALECAGVASLNSDMQQMVCQRLSTYAYPREIEFITARPKTPSGKIQRFILRGGA